MGTTDDGEKVTSNQIEVGAQLLVRLTRSHTTQGD